MKNINLSPKNRAWIELNMENLQNNINEFKKIISPKTEIMAVVKANAYGHGVIPISKSLNDFGISNFAVATLEEAIELRENGINGNILIFGYTHINDLKYVIKYDLIQTILDYKYANKINSSTLATKLNAYIKINTGLNRTGENFDNIQNLIKIYSMKNINVIGLFSHFAVADSTKNDDIYFSKKQIENFEYCINMIKKSGYCPGKLHIQNTYGTLNYPYLNYDYVRIGIGMYGIYNNKIHENNSNSNINLKPVLSLKSRITSIREIWKNESVSYGRKFIANNKTKIATISVGYADGYPRELSNKNTKILISGKLATIIGTICMDQMIIDISDISNASVGDIVTLVGDNENISAEKLSYNSNSISNELLCRFSNRLPRI